MCVSVNKCVCVPLCICNFYCTFFVWIHFCVKVCVQVCWLQDVCILAVWRSILWWTAPPNDWLCLATTINHTPTAPFSHLQIHTEAQEETNRTLVTPLPPPSHSHTYTHIQCCFWQALQAGVKRRVQLWQVLSYMRTTIEMSMSVPTTV